MRKKILATLLVGAVAATAAAGLTACGKDDGGVAKGEEVTEEAWKAAFAATVAAQNYTYEMTSDYKVSGTVDSKKYSVHSATEQKFYYDAVNNHCYSVYTETYKTSGFKDAGIEEEDYDESQTEKTYTLKDGDITWEAEYNSGDEQPAWEADEYGYMRSYAAYIAAGTYAAEKDGAQKALTELYSAFKYSGGYYAASLWTDFDEEELTEVKLTFSIKGGYVVGCRNEYKASHTEDGATETTDVKTSVTISKYGSTTVEAPAEAVAAINAKKTPPEGNDPVNPDPVNPDPVTPSNGSVAGKTYEFVSMVSPDNSAPAEMLTSGTAANAGSSIIFGTDGTFTMVSPVQGNMEITGTYTQNGANLVLTIIDDGREDPQDFTLNGEELVAINVHSGITLKVTYRLKTA